MADNLISLNNALQAALSGSITNTFITPTELTQLRSDIYHQENIEIDISYSSIQLHLLLVNDTWQLHLYFPIHEDYKLASLHRVHPIPNFVNGTRYSPLIETTYAAFTTHSNQFTTLTVPEAILCLQTPTRCRTTMPLSKAVSNICGISSFYNMPEFCQYSLDNTLRPFFLTIQNATFFSVPNKTTLYTHCMQVSNPGPEATTILTGKGLILTPPGCHLQTLSNSIYPHNYSPHPSASDQQSLFLPSTDAIQDYQNSPTDTRQDVEPFTSAFKHKIEKAIDYTLDAINIQRELMQTISALLALSLVIFGYIWHAFRWMCCPPPPTYYTAPTPKKTLPISTPYKSYPLQYDAETADIINHSMMVNNTKSDTPSLYRSSTQPDEDSYSADFNPHSQSRPSYHSTPVHTRHYPPQFDPQETLNLTREPPSFSQTLPRSIRGVPVIYSDPTKFNDVSSTIGQQQYLDEQQIQLYRKIKPFMEWHDANLTQPTEISAQTEIIPVINMKIPPPESTAP
jgi:hypothetical protein